MIKLSLEGDEVSEELDKKMSSIEGDDVGQKRFQMYEVLRFIVEKQYQAEGLEVPETGSRIEELKDLNGYMYKLVQEFLTSSSTLEKEKKLEKIVEHFKSRTL